MTYKGVAISGKAGAGKNAFASHVQRELERREVGSVMCGFADALKAEVREKYGLTKDDPGGREKLCDYGTEMRDHYPMYWVSRLAQSLAPLDQHLLPLITDCRYKNELDWAKSCGLLTVRLDVTRMDRMVVLSRRGEDVAHADSEHPSEVELDEAEFDVRFWNPHGDGESALRYFAVIVADRLAGVEVN